MLIVLFSDFDAVNPDAIRQLSKKQEETQRSLEKIERGAHDLLSAPTVLTIAFKSVLCPASSVDRVCRQT